MVIPRQAVLENQGKSFVYVIAQDSRARMVPVATGPAVGSDRIAVISGITPESLVIYDAWPISGRHGRHQHRTMTPRRTLSAPPPAV